MATTREKVRKDGTVSYEIRVSLGRDLNGKQILKYRTWTPEPGMTPAKIKKQLERQKVLFEDACRNGEVLDSSTKFAHVVDRWLDENENILSPAYLNRARGILQQANKHIGNIALGKLKTKHLTDYYDFLLSPKSNNGRGRAQSTNLNEIMKRTKTSSSKLALDSGLSHATIATARRGHVIQEASATKIANALSMQVTEIFIITREQKTISKSTVKYTNWVISSVLESAVSWEAINTNPAHKVKFPKASKKEAPYLDDRQALQVLDALQTAPLKWRTIIMLLIYSGMRRGELCGLCWDDIDFNNSIVHVSKSNQYLPGQGIFEKSTKNTNSVRAIKLPSEMMTLLTDYKQWYDVEREKHGDKWQESNKVFVAVDGSPIHPDSITRWVAKFRSSNDLPYFSPHTLRHTNATLLIMQGVPVKAVSARLGHASSNVTNSVYSHAIETVDAIASDVVGDLFRLPQKG